MRQPRKSKQPRPKFKSESDAWQLIVTALQDVAATPCIESWAEPPWKDWRNAAKLCSNLWLVHRTQTNSMDAEDAGRMLVEVFNNQPVDYWEIGDYRRMIPQDYSDPPASTALETALAIAQLGISRSDGGGAAFQDRLTLLFQAFVGANVDISTAVLHSRMIDALGSHANPKRVQAFKMAWEMGRCKLAYLV